MQRRFGESEEDGEDLSVVISKEKYKEDINEDGLSISLEVVPRYNAVTPIHCK